MENIFKRRTNIFNLIFLLTENIFYLTIENIFFYEIIFYFRPVAGDAVEAPHDRGDHVEQQPDEAALVGVEGEGLAHQRHGGHLRGQHRRGHQRSDQEHTRGVGRNSLTSGK